MYCLKLFKFIVLEKVSSWKLFEKMYYLAEIIQIYWAWKSIGLKIILISWKMVLAKNYLNLLDWKM